MVLGALPQVHQSQMARSELEFPNSPGKTGNTLPPEASEDRVSISEDGHSALERELRNAKLPQANEALVDLRGHEGKIRLGLMALGQSAVDSWLAKGLELNEESIIAAGEAFQDAFRKNLEENGSATAGSGIALNRHLIVINSQPVPDWFIKEYEDALSSLGDSQLRGVFEKGESFSLVKPSLSSSEALHRYAAVKSGF